jgi:uncharacterized protein YlxW (UPF0749 family)
MNPFEMVVLIVAIVMIASVLKSRHGHRHRHGRNSSEDGPAIESQDAARLREEVTRLKERVAVLERIATDKNHLLEQEIERLRDG